MEDTIQPMDRPTIIHDEKFQGIPLSDHPALSEFVGVFNEVLSEAECQRVINFFEKHYEKWGNEGVVGGGLDKTAKDSMDLQLAGAFGKPYMESLRWEDDAVEHQELMDMLSGRMWQCCGDYLENLIWNLGEQTSPPNNMIISQVYLSSMQIQKYILTTS